MPSFQPHMRDGRQDANGDSQNLVTRARASQSRILLVGNEAVLTEQALSVIGRDTGY